MQTEYIINKEIRNFFELKKKMKQLKTFLNQKKVVIFYINNYMEYKSNGDRNKTLSIKEYPEEI